MKYCFIDETQIAFNIQKRIGVSNSRFKLKPKRRIFEMAQYTDVYLLPIKTENIEAYREMAEKAGKIFRKHGAIGYRE